MAAKTATRPRSDTAPAKDQAEAPAQQQGKNDAGARHGSGRDGKRRLMPEGLAVQARQDAYATVWRLRRQALPHAATAAVLGGGLAADAIANLSTVSAPAVSAMTAVLTAPVAVWTARRIRRRRPQWATRARLAGLGAAGWLTLAPLGGVGAADVAVLTGFEVAVAARWWQTHRLGYPALDEPGRDGHPLHDVDAVELTLPEQIMADWHAHVAAKEGPAPGSTLTAPVRGRYGWEFTLQLAPAKQVYPDILNHLPKIASGLDVGVAALVLEQHPGHEAPRWCRLQVITDSPIAGNVDFDGPRRHDTWGGKPGFGLLELGPYADGAGEAIWQLYTPGSMWSGAIIGAPGIGKSRLIENIVISALSAGDTEYWFIDPNQGASSPALSKHADWFLTDATADDALAALLAILDARGAESGVEGWTGFTASPTRPGLLVVIDECHRIFTPDNAALWARVAREGRKLGVAILAVSQYAGLPSFGNSESLRSCIMVGNAIAMHVSSKTGKGLMAGLQVDPLTLPKIPGYGFTMATESGTGRTAPFRNRNTAPGGDGSVAEQWLAAQPRPGLDTLTATATLAAGTAYRDRHQVDEGGRAAAARRVAMLRDGHLPDNPFHATAPAATTGDGEDGIEYGQVIHFPTFTEHLRAAEHAPTEPTAQPTAQPAVREPAAAQPGRGRPNHLGPSYQAVWDAVAAGATRPGAVTERVGLSRRQVQDLLKELVATGHLTQPKYGHYQIAA